jgi:hypothetical protein
MNQEEMAAYYARERAKTAEAMAPVHAIAKLLGKFKREGRPVVWAEVQAVEAEARARFTRTDRPKLNSSRRIKA